MSVSRKYSLLEAGAAGGSVGGTAAGRGVVVATEQTFFARDLLFIMVGQFLSFSYNSNPTLNCGNRDPSKHGGSSRTFITKFVGAGLSPSFASPTSHQLILATGGGCGAGASAGIDAVVTTSATKSGCVDNPQAAQTGGGSGGAGGARGNGTDGRGHLHDVSVLVGQVSSGDGS